MAKKPKQNDWVRKNYFESLVVDIGLQFIKRYRILLWLYGVTKWNAVGRLLCRVESFYSYRVSKHWMHQSHYQPTLESHFKDIKRIWSKASLPPLVYVNSINDISGFGLYNAESIPWFGENHISVNSGICYHSHTFVRCLQPYFIRFQTSNRFLPVFFPYFQKKFRDSSVSFICEDYTYALMSISLIPEDDNLLDGVEQFVIAHELGHLMIKEHGVGKMKYEKYFNKETLQLIDSDEEIAADAFAIIILSYIKRFSSKSIYTLYAPQFIFKLLSAYETIGLLNEPTNHPSHLQRYTYIISMTKQLGHNELYNIFDEIIEDIWQKNKIRINNRCRRIIKVRSKYLSIVEDLYHRYK
jgi:hypothetical protein